MVEKVFCLFANILVPVTNAVSPFIDAFAMLMETLTPTSELSLALPEFFCHTDWIAKDLGCQSWSLI